MPFLSRTSRYLNQSKEDLSLAYVRAVAAAADCYVDLRDRDVDGIDGTLYQYNSVGTFPSQGLEFQAKCTEVSHVRGDEVFYDLPVGNYNRLCGHTSTLPAILILLLVPSDVRRWVNHTEERLLIRKCAYWADYRGLAHSLNRRTRRVRLNRADTFGVDELVQIMDLVTDDRF